jgi:hypothetical protein
MDAKNVELAFIADQATIANLHNELVLTERLDRMNDRAVGFREMKFVNHLTKSP